MDVGIDAGDESIGKSYAALPRTALDFLEVLVRQDVLSVADCDAARELCQDSGLPLVVCIMQLGCLAESLLLPHLSGFTGVPADLRASARVMPDRLADQFLIKHFTLPLNAEDGRRDLYGQVDPFSIDVRRTLRFANPEACFRLVPLSVFERWRAELFARETSGKGESGALGSASVRASEAQLDAPVIRRLNQLVGAAVERGASDVHIEPADGHGSRVRYRVDGRLQEVARLGTSEVGTLVSRVKVMAGLDIAEKRLPQDGRIEFVTRGELVDLRVATLPTVAGESVAIRILGRAGVEADLASLGLPDRAQTQIEQALEKPHGLILLTGPTGSGKTTTLYACLKRLLRPELKLVTVEDPVEQMIPGVTQVPVRPDIGLTFARTLRAFLRQDPNVLMIGEIRDEETAAIALQLAMVGRLVLSSLHTNSAIGAVLRLREMGVESYLIASLIELVVAQRLVRKLCACTEKADAPGWFQDLHGDRSVCVPRGCDACGHTGYLGRTPVVECVSADEALRELIAGDASEAAMTDHARQVGASSLAEHALALIRAGMTSVEEAHSVVPMRGSNA